MADEPLAQSGVGDPDAFGRLWTPHRMAYIHRAEGEGCPFCRIPTLSDEDVAQARQAIAAALSARLGGELRG